MSDEEVNFPSGNIMDSRTGYLDDELSDRLEEAFHKPSFNVHLQDVARIASEYNPIDLAYAASRLPADARSVLFENLPELTAQVQFIINTDSTTRVAIFRHIDDATIRQLIEKMPADEAIWVLDDLSERRCRRILEVVEPKKAEHIKELQKHSRKSAGGLMTNEFFAFPMETTIQEASSFIRNNPGIDMTRRIFVLDQKGELQGFVPARNLIVNAPTLPLKQVMRQVEHKVSTQASREEVVDIVERYKIPALPVVNEMNFLVGIITYEDVVEIVEDIADETIALMSGTIEDIHSSDPLISRVCSRSPWLLVTLFAGLVSASIMSYFQSIEAELLAIIFFFIPLINGMSGNVGVQCSTILVRGMAVGVITKGKKKEAALKEVSIGLMTGTLFGALCGLMIFGINYFNIGDFHGGALQLGVMVAFGVLSASLMATLLGVSSPFFFSRIGIDPAVASGPIVTAFNDILATTTFFLIAGIIHNVFF
jgi:magnesium transporter